jgi:ABC-2 type transport system permease protein
MFALGGLLTTFVTFYLWKAVYLNSGKTDLNGFTINNMLIYVFISTIVTRLISSNVDGVIAEEIRNGSIAMNLIKPINYFVRLLFESFGGVLYQFFFIVLPIWIGMEIFKFNILHENVTGISTIILFLVSIVFGFAINFLINFAFGLMSFFVLNLWGFRQLKAVIITFLSGAVIPIAFFPEGIQKIINFLPFSSLVYSPTLIYLGKIQGFSLVEALLIQCFWTVLLAVLIYNLWKRAVTRLTISGG